MVCSIVQTTKQFYNGGCPNCESILGLRSSTEAIQEYTTTKFEGLIALADPEASWVAKWQRLKKYVPGIYAVKVVGTLPEEVIRSLPGGRDNYIPRDGTTVEADMAA